MLAVPDDDALECDGDSGSNKGRSEQQSYVGDDEGVHGPGILSEHESSDVTDDFEGGTDTEPDHVAPCLCSDAEVKLGDEAGQEGHSEKDVGTIIKSSSIDSRLDRADVGQLVTSPISRLERLLVRHDD